MAEEQYLYPTARKVLPDGDEVADHEIAEHAEAEELMKPLENTDATDPKFDELVGKLMEDIRHHLEEEESDLLPKLRAACDADELRELGKKFENRRRWLRRGRTRPRRTGRRRTRSSDRGWD